MLERFRNVSDTETVSRRTILAATGGSMVGLVAAGTGATVAQTEQELDLSVTVHPEDEFITITNNAEEDADLTGYSINFDAEGGNDQIRQLDGDVVIGSGESIIVPTGARDVSGENVVELEEPYDGDVLNNGGDDIVEVLDQDMSPVATSEPASPPTDEGPYDGTGVVRVVNQDDVPVKGEVVWISSQGTVENSSRDVGYTDPDTGEVTIELSGLAGSDVPGFTIEVRDQEDLFGIAPDEREGVQETEFEVDSIGNEGNPTVVTAIDAETTEPIEGAQVAIDEEGGDPADHESWDFETDEFGRVEEDIEIGSYVARVSAEGYEDATKNVSLENYFHAELEPTGSDGSDEPDDPDDSDDSSDGSGEDQDQDQDGDDTDETDGQTGGDDPESPEDPDSSDEAPAENDPDPNCP